MSNLKELTEEDWEALGCRPWDVTDHLTDEESIEGYLAVVRADMFEEGNEPFIQTTIVKAIEDVNRARRRNIERQQQQQTNPNSQS